ncbi:MAG: hypothetical protein IT473_02550 [Lysobacter sp.]|nr:hypothetical protein [Lysobacter sp.]
MPLADIASGLFEGLARLVVEIVFELLIKGAGFVIVRPLYPRANPDGALVVVVGLAFWAGVIAFCVFAYRAQVPG